MGKDVALRKNTLPANWQEQLRKDAEEAKAAESGVGVGQFISTRAGQLSFQGTPVPGNKMRCVVLASLLVNAYYEGEFDDQNPQSPVCWAMGKVEAGLAPDPTAPTPQHEDCANCPQNKFGSAERGRGKACKNGRRLALIHVDDLKKDLKDAAVAYLNVPPTSLPSWATYVRGLEAQSLPPYAVVTEVSIVPDPKSTFKVVFDSVSEIKDKKILGGVYHKSREVAELIAFPFTPSTEAAAPKKTKRTAPAVPAKKSAAKTPARPAAAPAKAAAKGAKTAGGGFGGGGAQRSGKF